ncbi:hypothetical protein LEMLEM_LOCUS25053, partial [Lemmus lemmus]
SVVALGQRRPPAGERLEDAVGAALLVDAGRAGPLLRRLHLGLHAEPEALPAPRAAPGVARPPGRPLYPGARRREGVCLSRGGRRRCRRLSPSLASPSPRAGGCRPALIDSPPRQCLEGERRTENYERNLEAAAFCWNRKWRASQQNGVLLVGAIVFVKKRKQRTGWLSWHPPTHLVLNISYQATALDNNKNDFTMEKNAE